MVIKNANMLNERLKLTSEDTTITPNKYNEIKMGKINNNNQDNKKFKAENNYVKVLVEDPYNNRDIILKLTKKQKGVYV